MKNLLARALTASLVAVAAMGLLGSTQTVYDVDSTVAWLIGADNDLKPATRNDSILARAPWVLTPLEDAIATPQFEADRQAFVQDLMRNSRVPRVRAESLATYAVTEAYARRVPPALVFGVLMTENDDLRSSSVSSVGALGLMQIDPDAWLLALGRRFGTNLRDDRTNLRYGVFILSHYIHGAPDELTAEQTLRRGLLRYNGCVTGTNTPGCSHYPEVVRERIERLAQSQCAGLGFEQCIAEPLRLALSMSPTQVVSRVSN